MEYKINYRETVRPVESVDLVFSPLRGLRLKKSGDCLHIYDLCPTENRLRDDCSSLVLASEEIGALISGLVRFKKEVMNGNCN